MTVVSRQLRIYQFLALHWQLVAEQLRLGINHFVSRPCSLTQTQLLHLVAMAIENPIFTNFPEAKRKLIAFARENLDTLLVDALHAFVADDLIPFIVSRASDDNDDNHSQRMIRRWQVKPPSPVLTAWRWLRSCGFSYNAAKKSFYIDGHERIENKLHRKQFVSKFLTK
jgi:hypothetical protein